LQTDKKIAEFTALAAMFAHSEDYAVAYAS
jgi:hypothetical protein